jgi:hypothetical protein
LLLRGETLWFRDFSLYFVPMKALLVELWRAGELPLWDPHVRSGLPFLANPQTGVFYPLTLVLVLLGVDPGLTLFILLHFALAGGGFYLFLRAASFSKPSSACGALAFGLGGYLASLVNVLNNLQTAAWVPWILFFSIRLRSLRLGNQVGRYAWLGLTLSIALALLGGEFQLAGLGLVTGMALALIELRRATPDGRDEAVTASDERGEAMIAMIASDGLEATAACDGLGRARTRFGGRAWPGLLILAPLAAAGLVGFQLLPTLELLRHSVRDSGLSLELASADAFKPAWLFSLAFPRPALPGTATSGGAVIGEIPWLLSAYLGLGVVCLAALAVFGPRRRWTLVWSGAAVLGGLLALGSGSPLFRIAHDVIPGFASLRYPEKFLLLPALALPALAAAGVEEVEARRISLRGLALGGVTVALCWAGSLLWMNDPHRLSPMQASAQAGVIATATLLLLFAARARRLHPQRAALLLCGVIAADLWMAGRGVNPGVDWSFYDEPWAAEILDKQGANPLHYRIRTSPLAADMEQVAVVERARFFSNHYFFHAGLAPNLGQLYGNLAEDGMAGIETRATADLIDALVAQEDPRHALRLLRLEGVKYLVTSFPLPASEVVEVARHPDLPMRLMRLRGDLGRAYLTSRWEVQRGRRPALLRAMAENFPAGRAVVLNRAPSGLTGPGETSGRAAGPAPQPLHTESAQSPGRILRSKWRPSAVRLEVDVKRPAILVVTDTWYPGWRGAMDGRSVPLLRANGTQRAVAVPAGRHTVVLRYSPASFKLGVVLSLLSALGVAGIFLMLRPNRRTRGARAEMPATSNGAGSHAPREVAGVGAGE